MYLERATFDSFNWLTLYGPLLLSPTYWRHFPDQTGILSNCLISFLFQTLLESFVWKGCVICSCHFITWKSPILNFISVGLETFTDLWSGWMASCILVGTFKMNHCSSHDLHGHHIYCETKLHLLWSSCKSDKSFWDNHVHRKLKNCNKSETAKPDQKGFWINLGVLYFLLSTSGNFFTGHCFQTIQGRSFRCCSYTSEQGMLVKLKEIWYFPMFTTCKSNG